MERNWLIRTKQNQILGPVAKQKVVEFYHKGALGLDDEICSGNGYWFSFKEKDLLEKYLLGDIPQGYNPITESRSHLSKKENPERTTSINTAPVNSKQESFPLTNETIVLPNENELDYPDITLINKALDVPSQAILDVEVKLPNQDDLEFPDVEAITAVVGQSMNIASIPIPIHSVKEEERPLSMKSRPLIKKLETSLAESEDPIIYPKDDDLAYPDIANETSSQLSLESKEKSKEIKVNAQEIAPQVLTKEKIKEVSSSAAAVAPEEKKILHERKVKSSPRSIQKEGVSHLPKDSKERKIPEELKKQNDNYLMYILIMIVFVMIALFFYYYKTILNKPLPV